MQTLLCRLALFFVAAMHQAYWRSFNGIQSAPYFGSDSNVWDARSAAQRN